MCYEGFKSSRLKRFALILLSVVVVSCIRDDPNTPMEPGDQASYEVQLSDSPNVAVDFDTPESVKSMSGFLHGVGASAPHDSLLLPLRPTMWRVGNFNDYDRLITTFPNTATRPRITFVLSDQWGYPHYTTKRWPFEGADPANPYKEWEDFVRSMATQHKDKAVLWEIWNEPDIKPQFWGGNQDQFRTTYLRAYRILREVLGPNAMIGGPSYSSYNSWINPDATANPDGGSTMDYTKQFLDFCKVNGCQANFLTWHELHQDVPPIKDHLVSLKALAAGYPEVAIREFHVAESVGEKNHYKPGGQLGTLYYLEQGGADAGVKTCWNDSRGNLTCFNSTVDGLLTAGTFSKTAGWWLYKSYADGADARVRSTTNHSFVTALGSTRKVATADEAQVLVGYMWYDGAPTSASVKVTLNNIRALPFGGGSSVRVRVQRIPDSGESAVSSLSTTQDANVAVNNGIVELSLNVNLHEVYLVTLSAPTIGGGTGGKPTRKS